MKYEILREPAPDEKRAYLEQLGFTVAKSRVEIDYRWLGGTETETVFYRGISPQGDFLGADSPRDKRVTKYPARIIDGYRLQD
jgi:hypothetical protein